MNRWVGNKRNWYW